MSNPNHLLTQLSEGKKEAYTALIDTYESKIYNFAYRMVENKYDAEDITQETFIRIIEKARDLSTRDEMNLSAYTYKVAKNLTLNEIERKKKEKASDTLEKEDLNVYQDPERALLLKEQIQKTRRVSQDLSEGHRLALTLKELQGLTYQEMSEVMGMTKTNIGVFLLRARLKFKEAYMMSEISQESLSVLDRI